MHAFLMAHMVGDLGRTAQEGEHRSSPAAVVEHSNHAPVHDIIFPKENRQMGELWTHLSGNNSGSRELLLILGTNFSTP